MNAIPNDPKEVAESAMEYELEGRRILTEAGSKSNDPLSKATFEFLAEQELRHIEAIRAFAEALAKGSRCDLVDLPAPTSKLEAKEAIKGIFARFKSKFEAAIGKEEERQEVYAVAMDMERRGYDFYGSAAKRSTDAAARRLYDFLCCEEINHFEIIQETADFLKQPDAIMAVEERWMQI